mgnify:CR=1 FL=1
MCTQRSPYNWSEQLYQRHGETFNSYLTETVLPAMKEKHDEHLLKELVRRWFNHKIMNKWMKKFFLYLDRYYVRHHSLPTHVASAGLGGSCSPMLSQRPLSSTSQPSRMPGGSSAPASACAVSGPCDVVLSSMPMKCGA